MRARFKVGDRVRIQQPGLGAGPVGYEFTITERVHSWDQVDHSNAYYMGDAGGRGVWDAYLELAEPREVTEAEVEAGCHAFYNDPWGLTDWDRLAQRDPTLADVYRDAMRRALVAAREVRS